MFAPGRVVPRAVRPLRYVPLRKRSQPIRHVSQVAFQRVRFRQRHFTWKKLATYALYLGSFYAFTEFFFPDVEEIDEGEEEHDDSRGGKGDEEAVDQDEDSLFLPLGWAKRKPRTFYKGEDPEWQEFKSIAANEQRRLTITKQLVSHIRNTLANEPRLARRFGHINVKRGRYWLDISYPPGPPIEYERNGIEVTDDEIRWTTKPVTQLNQQRFQRAIWPTATFWSVYASARYLFRVQYYKVQELIGIQPTPDPHMQLLKQHMEKMHGIGRSSSNPTAGVPSPEQQTGEMASRTAAAPSNRKQGSNGSTTAAEGQKNMGLPQLPSISPFSDQTDVPIALSIFSTTLMRNWKPLSLEPPRGSVMVSGLIEVVGQKAWATMDVVAAYDPKENKYVSIQMKVRRVQDKSVAPRGR